MKYGSYVMKKSILFFSLITLCISMLSACGGRSASGSDDINPRDTVTVPEGYTGEDSIAYIENAVLKDHISRGQHCLYRERCAERSYLNERFP